MTFQELIFKLQQYWANQGCVIIQPYDQEVGAGEGTNYRPGDEGYTEVAYRPTQSRTGVELKFMDDETPIAFKIKHEVLLKNTWLQDSEGRPSWNAETWVPVDMDDGLYDYQKLLDDWED